MRRWGTIWFEDIYSGTGKGSRELEWTERGRRRWRRRWRCGRGIKSSFSKKKFSINKIVFTWHYVIPLYYEIFFFYCYISTETANDLYKAIYKYDIHNSPFSWKSFRLSIFNCSNWFFSGFRNSFRVHKNHSFFFFHIVRTWQIQQLIRMGRHTNTTIQTYWFNICRPNFTIPFLYTI
jgi:hypothetical protein